jgi:S-adenosyl-L-methionine hydrolase (adenosine-forming)
MTIITLTTDFGTTDHYLSALKGYIFSNCIDVNVIDISHDSEKYNISRIAYIFKNAYRYFPPGTIHLVNFFPEFGRNNRHLLIKQNGSYFIGSDNGFFSLVFESTLEEIYEISASPDATNIAIDVLATAACYIANGGNAEDIGTKTKSVQMSMKFMPMIEKSTIVGSVIYIDSFGNAITNISKDVFSEVGKGRSYTISFGSEKTDTINKRYNEVSSANPVVLFNDAELLEIGLNEGSAYMLLGLNISERIRIEFDGNQNS